VSKFFNENELLKRLKIELPETSSHNHNHLSISRKFCSWNRVVKIPIINKTRGSSFNIVARLRAGRSGFESRQGEGFFSLRYRVQTGSCAHPLSYTTGTGVSFPAIKRLRPEADHSVPSSTEVLECVELYLHSHNTSSWRGAAVPYMSERRFPTEVTAPSSFTALPLPEKRWRKQKHAA